MGKIWCQQCSTFFGESSIERSKHEKSSKHQYALSKQLKDLHTKNKIEGKELSLANKELLRINKELGIHSKHNGDNHKVHKRAKIPEVKPLKLKQQKDQSEENTPRISEWETVEKTESADMISDVASFESTTHKKFKETEGEKEINNWDLGRVRTIEVDGDDDDDDDDEGTRGLGKIIFKKRKNLKN